MPSVEQWANHFKRMAHRTFPHEDMYIVNQKGRGLGRNAYSKTVYKIRSPQAEEPTPPVAIVSDVAANVNRARALVQRESIKKKRTKRAGNSSSKGRSRKSSGKKRKKASPRKRKRTSKKK